MKKFAFEFAANSQIVYKGLRRLDYLELNLWLPIVIFLFLVLLFLLVLIARKLEN